MDKADVDKVVIFPFVEGNFTNDVVKVAFDEFPDRLIPYCAVNAWERGAAQQVRRCVTEWGFDGVAVTRRSPQRSTATGLVMAPKSRKISGLALAASIEANIEATAPG
jgi:hypothetical protein